MAPDGPPGWWRRQFASLSPILILLYLCALWLLLVNDVIDTEAGNSGAFLVSFFVLPIWMVADRLIQWKVGKAMLADEELGKDFIKPVKSQDVREIANSVMVIRVKFTANPGAHFLIRREAYKRITEALNQKGIYHAHRKVIVDVPPGLGVPENSAQTGFIAKGAGAADAAGGIVEKPSLGKDDPGD